MSVPHLIIGMTILCRFLTFLERALNFNNEGKGFFIGDKVYYIIILDIKFTTPYNSSKLKA